MNKKQLYANYLKNKYKNN